MLACDEERWEVAKQLAVLYPQIVATYNPVALFLFICDKEQFEVADWFRSTFSISIAIRCIEYNFREACGNGRLAVIQYLYKTFPSINVHATNMDHRDAFGLACWRGQLAIAKWLVSEFPDIDVHAKNDKALGWVCNAASYEFMCWLLTFYTAEQFWTERVQYRCHKLLKKWRMEVEPRRREFMTTVGAEFRA